MTKRNCLKKCEGPDGYLLEKEYTLTGKHDVCIYSPNKKITKDGLTAQPIKDIKECEYDPEERYGIF